MARVQTPGTMGNTTYDPGIAQSVMTGADIGAKEGTAMADIAGRSQVAKTQAGAQVQTAQIGADADMAMNRQRLAAQKQAQDTAAAHETHMKMMDNEWKKSMQADQARFDAEIQREVMNNQAASDSEKWKKGKDLWINTMAYESRKGIIATMMKMKLAKMFMSNMEGRAATLQDAEQQNDIGEKRMLAMAGTTAAIDRGFLPDSPILQSAGAALAAETAGRTANARVEWMKGESATSENKPYAGVTAKGIALAGFLRDAGIEGVSGMELTQGGSAGVAAMLSGLIDKGELKVDSVQHLITMADALMENTKKMEDKDALKPELSRLAYDLHAGFTQLKMGGSDKVKSVMSDAMNWSAGTTTAQIINKQVKETGRFDIDEMMGWLTDVNEALHTNYSGELKQVFYDTDKNMSGALRRGMGPQTQPTQRPGPVRTERRY